MKRIMLVVAYDGTDYCGYQIQPKGRTIESELNKALSELTGEEIQVSGASRTDSGVHALCNLVIFDTDSRIPADKFCFALNQRLPEDIRIRNSYQVRDDFHPRFAKTVKTYEYRIWNDRIALPQKRYDTHFFHRFLDVDKMNEAIQLFVGEHDFKGFCSANAQVQTTVREILSARVYERQQEADCALIGQGREVVIRISGKGFLYNMVRIITGTIMEVGTGDRSLEQVREAIERADRNLAGPTAPAKGLTLVGYEFIDDNGICY